MTRIQGMRVLPVEFDRLDCHPDPGGAGDRRRAADVAERQPWFLAARPVGERQRLHLPAQRRAREMHDRRRDGCVKSPVALGTTAYNATVTDGTAAQPGRLPTPASA
jgi:hypothetical protein